MDGGFGRRKARQKRFAGSNDDRRLVFGGECVDGILPGEKGDLYDLYPHSVPSLKHQDLLACFFQVECGPEARHARSDDDDVPRLFDATHADPLTVIIWLGWGC